MADDNNDYLWLEGQIKLLDMFLHEHPETKERMINWLIINLQRANKYIENEIDKQALIKRIVNELLKIRYPSVKRRDDNFVHDIDMPWKKG